ncbi:hypothetical protein [Nocardia puris]|uniref:hypothetical protein n=1 Tax=Nocardia puris TaxID=208602 RepID=UPI002E238863
MLLPRSEFPDGNFHFSPIRTVDGLDPTTDECDPRGWVRDGDQETAANVTFDEPNFIRYNIELFAVHTDPGLAEWEVECLPYSDSRTTFQPANLPGAPEWATTIEVYGPNSESTAYSAVGYYRGILVQAYVSGNRDDLNSDALELVALLFQKQVERLQV